MNTPTTLCWNLRTGWPAYGEIQLYFITVRPFWFIPIHLFVATGYTDASSVAVGSVVVLSHAGENFVEPFYWSDNATPQAGKIFAEHGHVVDVCLLTEEQRKKSSTLRELLGLIRMCMVHLQAHLAWSLYSTRIRRQRCTGQNNDQRKSNPRTTSISAKTG